MGWYGYFFSFLFYFIFFIARLRDLFLRACECVYCHLIYSGRQTCGRASQCHKGERSHRISPLSFCGACLDFLFFTLTDRASTIPSNIRGCQSGTWPQRGTKVNGSHHGDNPLLRPTGIQIATKNYATLQVMAPTNSKPVHQTSSLHIISRAASIDSDYCRLPTTSVLSIKSDTNQF